MKRNDFKFANGKCDQLINSFVQINFTQLFNNPQYQHQLNILNNSRPELELFCIDFHEKKF